MHSALFYAEYNKATMKRRLVFQMFVILVFFAAGKPDCVLTFDSCILHSISFNNLISMSVCTVGISLFSYVAIRGSLKKFYIVRPAVLLPRD